MKQELKNLIKSIVAKKNKIKFSEVDKIFTSANNEDENKEMFALLEYDITRFKPIGHNKKISEDYKWFLTWSKHQKFFISGMGGNGLLAKCLEDGEVARWEYFFNDKNILSAYIISEQENDAMWNLAPKHWQS